MKTKFTLLLIMFLTVMSVAKELYAQKTVTGFEAPESVVKYGDKLFVSNIGGTQPNPMAVDSNGFISELSVDGNIIQKKFAKAILNGPKGLAISKDVLYTADINRIVGFDINSGEQVFELLIKSAGFLNDLCTINDGVLGATDSYSGRVYVVNATSKTYDSLGTIPGANGITYNAATKQLFACGMGANMNGTGKLFVKELTNQDTVFTVLQNSPTGVFDGLELIDNDHLLATDWISMSSTKGRIVIYDLKAHTVKAYSIDMGPADIHYDQLTGMFYLPELVKNTLLIESIKNLKED